MRKEKILCQDQGCDGSLAYFFFSVISQAFPCRDCYQDRPLHQQDSPIHCKNRATTSFASYPTLYNFFAHCSVQIVFLRNSAQEKCPCTIWNCNYPVQLSVAFVFFFLGNSFTGKMCFAQNLSWLDGRYHGPLNCVKKECMKQWRAASSHS